MMVALLSGHWSAFVTCITGLWLNFTSTRSLKLQARFTPFIVPLMRVAQVLQSNENAGPLRGSLLCVSGDGTIAVVSIEGFEM